MTCNRGGCINTGYFKDNGLNQLYCFIHKTNNTKFILAESINVSSLERNKIKVLQVEKFGLYLHEIIFSLCGFIGTTFNRKFNASRPGLDWDKHAKTPRKINDMLNTPINNNVQANLSICLVQPDNTKLEHNVRDFVSNIIEYYELLLNAINESSIVDGDSIELPNLKKIHLDHESICINKNTDDDRYINNFVIPTGLPGICSNLHSILNRNNDLYLAKYIEFRVNNNNEITFVDHETEGEVIREIRSYGPGHIVWANYRLQDEQ